MIRAVLAIAPLVWVARRVDVAVVADGIVRVGPLRFLAALGFQAAGVALGALRWRVLMMAFGADEAAIPDLPALFRHCLVGVYYALLPTGLVGDIVRANRTTEAFANTFTSFVVTLTERLLGAAGLLAVFSVAAAFGRTEASVVLPIAVLVGVLVLGASVALATPAIVARSAWLRARLARGTSDSEIALPRIGDRRRLVLSLLLSVGTQALTVAMLESLLYPFASGIDASTLAVASTAIVLLIYVPITPGAIGQREVAFVACLGPLGVAAAEATAASIALFGVTLALAAIGGVIHMAESRVPR